MKEGHPPSSYIKLGDLADFVAVEAGPNPPPQLLSFYGLALSKAVTVSGLLTMLLNEGVRLE